MSKRPSKTTPTTSRRTKRARQLPAFGASLVTDDRPQRANNPSSSALSTTHLNPASPASLATLSARVFAEYFDKLSDEEHWLTTREWLKVLPDVMAPKLLAMLRTSHPKLLSHAVLATVRVLISSSYAELMLMYLVLPSRTISVVKWRDGRNGRNTVGYTPTNGGETTYPRTQ